MNTVILIGYIGGAPKVTAFKPNEKGEVNKVANVSLATSISWKDKNGDKQSKTEWHNLTFKNQNLVNIVETHVKKGSRIAVTGTLAYRDYNDKDNVKRYVTEIVCHKLEFLGGNQNPKNPQNDDLPF